MWLADRVLPDVVSAVAFAGLVWLSHHRLHRHVTRVTDQQTRKIRELTAEQTAELKDRAGTA